MRHEFEIANIVDRISQARAPMGGPRFLAAHVLVIGHCVGVAILAFEVWEKPPAARRDPLGCVGVGGPPWSRYSSAS